MHVHIFSIVTQNRRFILSQETHDLLLTTCNFLAVFFCNNTKQHIFRSVHSQHHSVPNNHAITQGHPFKNSKFIDKSCKTRKAVLTISHSHDICHLKAITSPNLTLNPSYPNPLDFLIGNQVPLTHFSAC